MRIRNLGPAISGAPPAGEIGEVSDKLGEMMVRRGFAVRVDTLSDRLGTPLTFTDQRAEDEFHAAVRDTAESGPTERQADQDDPVFGAQSGIVTKGQGRDHKTDEVLVDEEPPGS